MAEFFVYSCGQCGSTYSGAVEAVDRLDEREESTGICSTCLEQLFGMGTGDEGMERREANSDTAPNV